MLHPDSIGLSTPDFSSQALGRVTGFAYDSPGRVTQTAFPSAFVETYEYDAVGNLTSKTDRKGQTISYTYDALNRLMSKQYPGGAGVDYTYDLANRLAPTIPPPPSDWAQPSLEGSRAADPNLELVGQTDFTDSTGRYVEYWLQKHTGGFPSGAGYTVFEHQSDTSLTDCPDGFSPCGFWAPDDLTHLSKFDDVLRPDTRTHRSWQTFTYQRPKERRFAIRRIYRTVYNSQTGLSTKELVGSGLQITIPSGGAPLINGLPAPYMGR